MADGFEPWDFDALVPANIAAQAVYVSRQLFNYWRRTNKIQPKGVDPKTGRKLYRLGDVHAVEKAVFNTPNSSRRAAYEANGGSSELKPVEWTDLNMNRAS